MFPWRSPVLLWSSLISLCLSLVLKCFPSAPFSFPLGFFNFPLIFLVASFGVNVNYCRKSMFWCAANRQVFISTGQLWKYLGGIFGTFLNIFIFIYIYIYGHTVIRDVVYLLSVSYSGVSCGMPRCLPQSASQVSRSWKIGFIGFFKSFIGFLLGFIGIFGTVTAFCNFLIVFIGFSKKTNIFKAKYKEIHWKTKQNI